MTKKEKGKRIKPQKRIHAEVIETGKAKPTSIPVQAPAPGKIIHVLRGAVKLEAATKVKVDATAATPRDSLLIILQQKLADPKMPEKLRADFARVFSILLDHLETLKIKWHGDTFKMDFSTFTNSHKKEVEAALSYEPLQMLVAYHLLPHIKKEEQQEPEPDRKEKREKPGQRKSKETGIFRKPKALVEQILLPVRLKHGEQLTFFDDVPEDMKQGLKEAPPAISWGINITPEEERLLTTISKLLHKKSQTRDKARPDYYTGNRPPVTWPLQLVIPAGRGVAQKIKQEDTAPVIALSFYELVQEYYGTLKPTGENYTTASRLLDSLTNKRFFMSYSAEVETDRGTTLKASIRTNEPLILRREDIQAKEEKAGEVLFEKREIVLTLHPIVKHEISKRYLTYPDDIQKQMQDAWGPGRLPGCVPGLRDYLLAEQFRGEAEISLLKIYPALGLSGLVERRKAAEARAKFERAADVWKKLGLLDAWEVVPNSEGGEKAVFLINKKWPRD